MIDTVPVSIDIGHLTYEVYWPISRRGQVEMQAHQERVIAEKAELDDKLSKLTTFLTGSVFASLDKGEQARLIEQEAVMIQYSGILAARIAAFQG